MPHTERFSAERSSIRPRRARRLGPPERLEDRNLLSATIYTVDAVTDTGAGSGTTGDLQYVIDQADANPNPDGSLIQFDPTVFATPRTITLSSPLELSEAAGPEVISGPGAGLVTISGNRETEVFSVANGTTATLEGLTIANGMAYGGGAVYNSGTLTLADSTLTSDSASLGGGIFNNAGALTISGSTLANESASLGGGIFNNGGMVSISDSTLADELAADAGGGIYNSGKLIISSSTLSGDSAADGGAVDNLRGQLTIVDTTLAGNSAQYGGGIDLTFGPLTVVNDTIAYNTATGGGAGGGLYIHGGTATLDNSIVAMNTLQTIIGPTPDDISQSGGEVSPASADNLIGTGSYGDLSSSANNQVGVPSPGLGALAYNGGPTQTIALLPGSPAIAGGSTALAVDPTTGQPLEYDQRGSGFDRTLNGTVDIGAFEHLPDTSDTVSVDWGTADTAVLQTAADGLRLLPKGRTTDLPWLGIEQLQITLGQAQVLTAADITINSAIGMNYGPVTVSGSGMNYTITLAHPIDAADRVTITIVNPGVSTFNRQLDVLPGDLNDDGVVDSQDIASFREQWLRGDRGHSIFDDINGDGQVDVEDYELIRAALGTRLPAEGTSLGREATERPAFTGSGSGAVTVQVGVTSRPASSGRPANQAVPTSGGPTGAIYLTARGRGWSLGTSSKNAVIGGAPPAGS
jgi:hypothetical protein